VAATPRPVEIGDGLCGSDDARVVALAGGVGAAKLVWGLAQEGLGSRLSVVVNTGDDLEAFGLRICPDLDTITYTLAGLSNQTWGWGIEGDTFRCLEALGRLGADTWFGLGDQDLATHLWRTSLLNRGWGLAAVTAHICKAFGIEPSVLPMAEGYNPTLVETAAGRLHLQEYLVREKCAPRVHGFEYTGLSCQCAAPGVEKAIRNARIIVICPSNPFISVGPILSVPGIRRTVAESRGLVVAVSPIVGGRALKGPAAKMLRELGHPVSAEGVARIYRGLLDVFVLDERDAGSAASIERLGVRVVVRNTVMDTSGAKRALACALLRLA
jgi:LPPG:FO 2-phospho-L-lactate transferase